MTEQDELIYEADIAAAIRVEETGAEPTVGHLSSVRALLLTRTTQNACVMDSAPNAARQPRRILPFVITISIVASLLFLVSYFAVSTSESFADILKITRQQPWIHASSTIQQNGETVESEYWCSPSAGVFAARHPQTLYFANFTKQIQFRYDNNTKRITKFFADRGTSTLLTSVLESLLSDGDIDSVFPMHETTRLGKETVEVGGKLQTEYRFHVQQIGNENVHHILMIAIDSGTNNLARWEEKHSSGMLVHTQFDYPESGPEDIFSVGAPTDAPVIDRTAASNVVRIEDQFREVRTGFDDYDAIVVQTLQNRTFSPRDQLSYLNLMRVRRHVNKFRIDHLLMAKPEVEVLDNTVDKAWWKKNRDRFWSVPALICDGNKYVTFSMIDDRIPDAGMPNLKVSKNMTSSLSAFPGDHPVPWPHLMPEYVCRPHLWVSDSTRRFEFKSAEDVARDTIDLVIHTPDNPISEKRASYRLLTDETHCVVKAMEPVIDRRTSPPKIVYVNTEEFLDFDISPRGYRFPTLKRRTTSDSDAVQLTSYYVDFNVEFDDGLFSPEGIGE